MVWFIGRLGSSSVEIDVGAALCTTNGEVDGEFVDSVGALVSPGLVGDNVVGLADGLEVGTFVGEPEGKGVGNLVG